MSLKRHSITDILAKAVVVVLALLALAPLFLIIGEAIIKGGKVIIGAGLNFFTQPPPSPGGASYGILTALVGSLELAAFSTLIGIPIASIAALLAVEFPSSFIGKLVRVFARTLLEVPTIVIGLFVFLIVVLPMKTYSILAASLALSITILPYVLTYVETSLRNVPYEYKEAGYALGMTRAQVAFRVLIPIARRGILTGFIIGTSKALGETAPLLFTLGNARTALNTNPLDPGDAIPLLIFNYANSPYENWNEVAWGATLVLILIIVFLQIVSRYFVREVKL